MKRFLMTSLLALPLVGLCQQQASAFFTTCGEFHKKWSFTCPRIIFGIDSGCAAPYTPLSYGAPCGMNMAAAGAMPWYAGGYPNAGMAMQPTAPAPQMAMPAQPPQAPAAAQPVSYQHYAPAAGYANYYYAPSYSVPAYWYGR